MTGTKTESFAWIKTQIPGAPAGVAASEGHRTPESTFPSERRLSARHSNVIAFCDVDGVLNNPWCYGHMKAGNRVPADPRCVDALNFITRSTGALIVVSSTWRFGGLMFCRERFSEWGVEAPVMDITPRLIDESRSIAVAQARGQEIAAWLRIVDGFCDVSSFVILDDDDDMHPHGDRLVQTNGSVGLTMADAAKALEILKRPHVPKVIEVAR
jgi:hypothetical protein